MLRVSDEDCLRAVEELKKADGNISRAARALGGIDRGTFRKWIFLASKRGLAGTKPVLPGYEIAQTSTQLGPNGETQKEWVKQRPERGEEFAVPDGHSVKGISALVDADGRTIQQWVKTREERGGPEDIAAAFAEAIKSYAVPKVAKPKQTADDLLTVYVLPDLHFGLLSWGKETGENYDVSIATQIVRESVAQLVAQSQPSSQAVILGLGDYFHQNDAKNMTPRSGHILDVDGRWAKVMRAGAEVALDITSIAAARHSNVLLRFLPGNHDPDSSIALTVALAMCFRNNDRIRVDDDPGFHFYYKFGKVLLGATHGHTMKPERMSMMLAADRPKDWGETIYRHMLFGHIHHESAKEVGAVRVESFSAPAAKDAHAHSGGWRSGRALTAITFHKERGEIGRHRVNIQEQS